MADALDTAGGACGDCTRALEIVHELRIVARGATAWVSLRLTEVWIFAHCAERLPNADCALGRRYRVDVVLAEVAHRAGGAGGSAGRCAGWWDDRRRPRAAIERGGLEEGTLLPGRGLAV